VEFGVEQAKELEIYLAKVERTSAQEKEEEEEEEVKP
jgi:hypothetical protein